MPHSPSFSELGLSEPLALNVERLGFTQPTPVQSACIPAMLGGRDVLGEAQTGTGKTGAFGLPLIDRIDAATNAVQALVITPTRELANQVAEALASFAKGMPSIDILPVYGGQPMGVQLRRLRAGPQIVVGTPGRIVDHMKRGT
ncbi:MAG TPA: DEAD/DEAH box helicase, partial [Thioalkalivibrio sp.]|nr:DEAD/DEAH box helicase [Thioalkalivibrio sp.]